MSATTPLPPSLDDIVFHVLDPLEAAERDVFLTRAEAWYPDLLDGLTTLYGDAVEEEALNLLALAARAYTEREHELRRLDLTRTLDPAWARAAEIPAGWRLSPRSVRAFVVGDEALGVTRKFYGDDPLVDRAVVTLLGHQGLMLVGEPGTAKSMLSELLSAAISGVSTLTVQGSAGTTEDHIRYSWNYALLIAEGPSRRALVPSPVYRAMESGRLMRFEEITRCPPEIQDTLVSVLSEKQLMVPELGDGFRVAAARGFNVIATANLRDRGVHEMSAALKRRFNFETVRPIADRAFEAELITRALDSELGPRRAPMSPEVLDVLVTAFADPP